ncbi:MAG TPA: hypothetical protein VF548_16725 [Allosphingosinicella sp.]
MARRTTQKSSTPTDKALRIVRPATFVRLLADDAVVVDLGRDIEIACITVGSPLTRQVTIPSEDSDIVRSQIETSDELSEVGRVRMPPFVALNAAMNILDNLIGSDQVDIEALKQAIDGIIAKHANSESSGGD